MNYSQLLKNNFHLTQSNSYGLYLSNSTGYKIEENIFQKNYFAARRTMGLIISSSGSDENEVYKNSFENLYVGQNFIGKNSIQAHSIGSPATGLQTLCNSNNNQSTDIFVGTLPPDFSLLSASIRNDQGTMQSPAGNCFSQNISPQFESISPYTIDYYYSSIESCQSPSVSGLITKHLTNNNNSCPSKIGSMPNKGEFNLEQVLTQYDEWNSEYEYWLKKLLTTEPDSEEYFIILDQVSYFSALKDNYFNGIIVAVMGAEEAECRMQNAEGEEGENTSHSSSLTSFETLRYLFNYRGHYTDNLSIVETYLAESNFGEALETLAKMHRLFKLTEEQVNEITGLQVYVLWLQQLENDGNNIYKLSENELDYLINFVKTNTGRGVVFAHNILCELYGICLEGEGTKGRMDENSPSKFEGVDGEAGRGSLSALSACHNITLVPNPTTGELSITNYELGITNVEVYDIYGKKHHLITSSSNHLINIVSLPAGIYFIKISTEVGDVVRKIIKN